MRAKFTKLMKKIFVITLYIFFITTKIFSMGDPPMDVTGPLFGKNIVISQGHGYRYEKEALRWWGYERSEIISQEGIVYLEDHGTNLLNRHLRNYLISNGGAIVRNVREMVIDDNIMYTDPWPGSINPNVSRWKVNARYYMRANPYGENVPATVYDSLYPTDESSKNLRSRPYYANWYHRAFTPSRADIYVSLHTNAVTGNSKVRGTETLYSDDTTSLYTDYDGTDYVVSQSVRNQNAVLATKIQNKIVQIMRSFYDPDWVDRGLKIGTLAETARPRIPACLIEYAFHTATGPPTTKDYYAITSETGRRLLAQATYKGICDYFGVSYNLPSKITDLAAMPGPNPGEIILGWTAPGENGTLINVSSYTVRYATTPITNDTEFNSASLYVQNWTPRARYQRETKLLVGFTQGVTYYFAVKSTNDTRDTSQLSNCVNQWGGSFPTGDIYPPSAVTDLSAQPGQNAGEIKLFWTSPGDDGIVGNLVNGKWRISYSTNPNYQFTISNYQLQITTSISALSAVSYTISALSAGTTYYFRLWTADENQNWSEISNGATTFAKSEIVTTTLTVKLFGYVRDQDDRPLAGAECNLSPGDYNVIANTAGFYEFILCNIQSQNYKLTVSSNGFVTYINIDLPSSGEVNQDIVLAWRKVIGMIKSTDGEPINSAKISLGNEIVYTDNNGCFEIKNLSEGYYELIVEKGGYRKYKKRIEVNENNDLGDIRLIPYKTLEIVVPEKKLNLTSNKSGKAKILFSIAPNENLATTVIDAKIFNVYGKIVRSGNDIVKIQDGQGSIEWDYKDNAGRQVAAGIYFYQIKVGEKISNGKIVIVK